MRRVILLAQGFQHTLEPLSADRPSCLFRLVDKSILVHIIESLVRAEFTHFEVICHHFPEHIRAELESGEQWGIQLNYHLARDPLAPFDAIRGAAKQWEDSTLLIGQADEIPLDAIEKLYCSPSPTAAFLVQADANWSGWATVGTESLASLPKGVDARKLPEYIPGCSEKKTVADKLSTRSFRLIQESHHLILSGACPHILFPTGAKEQGPGIWISPKAQISPSAQLNAPVFIGENTQVGEGVKVGPYSVIEKHCVIDNASTVQNTMICRNSYVGEGLELVDSIVDRNILISLKNDAKIVITDDFILAPIDPPSLRKLVSGAVERFFAAVFLLFLSPLLLLLSCIYPVKKHEVVKLPQKHLGHTLDLFFWYEFNSRWKTIREVLVLWHILKGEAHFVGVAPRTQEKVEQLSDDWRSLYLNSKLGWIRPTQFSLDPSSADECYFAEAYYATHMSPWFDFTLIVRSVGTFLLKPLRSLRALRYSGADGDV